MQSHNNLLKNQSCRHPERSIVQADQAVHIGFCPAVIPGTHIVAFEKGAADVFTGEDAERVDPAPEEDGLIFNMRMYRFDECGKSVDGEHPDRSLSHQPEILIPECMEGGKQDLHTPSGQAAD